MNVENVFCDNENAFCYQILNLKSGHHTPFTDAS